MFLSFCHSCHRCFKHNFFPKYSADQFKRLRDGDRFFFTHNNVAGSISEQGRNYILNRKFSDIICHSTNIEKIQPDVFRIPNDNDNKLQQCTRNKDDELIKIIQADNFMKKCKKGYTNLPKCDECSDGYYGYPICLKSFNLEGS